MSKKGMLFQELAGKTRATLDSGSVEQNFRAFFVLLSSGLLLLTLVFSLAAQLNNDNTTLALYNVLMIGLLGCTVSFMILTGRINFAVPLFVLLLAAITFGLLFLEKGENITLWGAVPVVLVAAYTLTNERFASVITLVSMAFFGYAYWAVNTGYWTVSFDANDSEQLANAFFTGLMSIAFCSFLLGCYRTITEKARQQLIEAEKLAGRANEETIQLLNQQQSSNQKLLKLQEVGKLTTLWYMPAEETVYLPNEEGGAPLSYHITEVRGGRLGIWGEKLAMFLTDSRQAEKSYEVEFSCQDEAGEQIWYRCIGEKETDENGNLRVLAVLQNTTETNRLTSSLYHKASHDELTGLYNRSHFDTVVNQAIDEKQFPASYIFLDLNRFKVINDTSGHSAGDALLQRVSEALRSNVRDGDQVARMGGDEFAILMTRTPPRIAAAVAEKINQDLSGLSFEWADKRHHVSASMGVVSVSEEIDIDTLQQLADTACYESRACGGNVVMKSSSDDSSLVERRDSARLVTSINTALDSNGFILFGQEIKVANEDAPQRRRFEVLLRMVEQGNHKLLMPGAFLPIAERYHLCDRVDEWVVENVIAALQSMEKSWLENCSYWINLSGDSLSNQIFCDRLLGRMAEAKLPESTVNFEIGESAAISNLDNARYLMSGLHDVGCKLALDDFGSSNSSFAYLKKLPVDVVKLDGTFIRNIDSDKMNRIVAKSMFDVARSLDMQTVATFVENDKIRNIVIELGADFLQGFSIHRPSALFPADQVRLMQRVA